MLDKLSQWNVKENGAGADEVAAQAKACQRHVMTQPRMNEMFSDWHKTSDMWTYVLAEELLTHTLALGRKA